MQESPASILAILETGSGTHFQSMLHQQVERAWAPCPDEQHIVDPQCVGRRPFVAGHDEHLVVVEQPGVRQLIGRQDGVLVDQ